ncbi:MAG: class I SAM-dependent methyltransferase [Bdellovibrionales bacterium]
MSLILDPSLESYPLWQGLREQIQKSKYLVKTDVEMRLLYEEGILKLTSKKFPNVYCDFLSEKYLKEVRQSFGRSEGVFSFLRPVSKNQKIKICDLTVGMGKDLFKFVLAGHDVVGFERNPVFYHMVLNGIERFHVSKKVEELRRLFKVEDFKVNLKLGEADCGGEEYDLSYFDPMFSDDSKKAAPKKGMQALKALSSASLEEDKIETIRLWKKNSKHFVYKCSGRTKDLPFEISKEIKGKGFSYLIL